MRSDLSDFVMFRSITVAYSDDDMRCDVLYNGEPTSLYGKRESYDAAFHIYVAHRPDSPILTETKGWGVVGGISMLLDALLAQPAPSETEGREMIRKRAKLQRIDDMLGYLVAADAALCRAALTNVLTGRSEQRLLHVLHVLRMFADDLERHLPAPSDRLPSSTPPPAQRAAHGGTDDRKAEAADLPRVKRAGQAIRGGDDA